MVLAAPLFLVSTTRSLRAFTSTHTDVLRNVVAGVITSYLALRMLSKIYELDAVTDELRTARALHSHVLSRLNDSEWVRHTLARAVAQEVQSQKLAQIGTRKEGSASTSALGAAGQQRQGSAGSAADADGLMLSDEAVERIRGVIQHEISEATRHFKRQRETAETGSPSLAWTVLETAEKTRRKVAGLPENPVDGVTVEEAQPGTSSASAGVAVGTTGYAGAAAVAPTPASVVARPESAEAAWRPPSPPAVKPLPRQSLI